ncbi:MAG: hypothetical protein R2795_11620 [Saprospiraceae bacterium]
MHNDPLYSFYADSTDWLFLWLGLFVCVGAFGFSYRFLTKKASGRAYTMNSLGAMLLFFVGMMALGTAVFSGWNLYRHGKVLIYADHMQIGNQSVPYTEINELFIRKDNAKISISASGSTNVYFLVITLQNGQSIALSEEEYPVREVMERVGELNKK